MAGVNWPMNIGTEEEEVGRTLPSQENGAPGGSVGSGETAFVSMCVSSVITSAGVVRRRPDVSSRITERSIESVGFSNVPAEDRKMDLRATLGLKKNTRISASPYFCRQKLRAWRIRRRVVFLSCLKQSFAACRVVVPLEVESGCKKTPKESRSLGDGQKMVRRDSDLATLN